MGYGGPVRDPFRLTGPDGQTYFDLLNPPRSLVPLYLALSDRIKFFEAEATKARRLKPAQPEIVTYWSGWALKAKQVLVQLEQDMAEAARQAAIAADLQGRYWIKVTQVRPDTSKQRHMEDNLRSRHIPTPGLDLAVVGLFDIGELDKTATAHGTYWEAQEFGTDAHVGRIVRGFFMPGSVRPDPSQDRQHPEFQPGAGPKMVIGNPIEERGFLRRAVEDAGRRREVVVKRAQDKVVRFARQYAAARAPRPRPAVISRQPRR